MIFVAARSIKQVAYFFCAVSILVGLGYSVSKPKPISRAKPLSLDIDTSVKELNVRQFDANGQLIHLFTSPLMQHFPKRDAHVFQNPYILIAEKDKSAWEIRAKMAEAFHEGSHIVFKNEVVIHQNASNKNPESTLKTEKITYYPKEKKASTKELVTFLQAGNFMQSRGMKAYLDEKRVDLLHQARGSYVPTKG